MAAGMVVVGLCVVALAQLTIATGVRTDPLGPRAFPIMLGVGIALCGVLLAVGSVLPPSGAAGIGLLPSAYAIEADAEDNAPTSYRRFGAVVLATALYIALFEPLGHLLATPLYVAAILVIHRGVAWRTIAIASVLVSGALFLGFRALLQIPIPGGLLDALFLRS